jgi:hypothetical protein
MENILNNLTLAEKFLAFDGIYDSNGSYFFQIQEETKKMFDKHLPNLSEFITDKHLTVLYNTIDKDNRKIPVEKDEYLIYYISRYSHAFSVGFHCLEDNKYDIYFFNSGLGVNFHPIKKEDNENLIKKYGCYLIKRGVPKKRIELFFENETEFDKIPTVGKEIDKYYDLAVSTLFLPLKVLEDITYNDNFFLETESKIVDEVIYDEEQTIGNCTGRSVLYHLLIIYYLELKDVEKAQLKFNNFKNTLSLLIFYDIIQKMKLIKNSYYLNNPNWYNENIETIKITQILAKQKFQLLDEENKLKLNDKYLEIINFKRESILEPNSYLNEEKIEFEDLIPLTQSKEEFELLEKLSKSEIKNLNDFKNLVRNLESIYQIIFKKTDKPMAYFLFFSWKLSKILNSLIKNTEEHTIKDELKTKDMEFNLIFKNLFNLFENVPEILKYNFYNVTRYFCSLFFNLHLSNGRTTSFFEHPPMKNLISLDLVPAEKLQINLSRGYIFNDYDFNSNDQSYFSRVFNNKINYFNYNRDGYYFTYSLLIHYLNAKYPKKSDFPSNIPKFIDTIFKLEKMEILFLDDIDIIYTFNGKNSYEETHTYVMNLNVLLKKLIFNENKTDIKNLILNIINKLETKTDVNLKNLEFLLVNFTILSHFYMKIDEINIISDKIKNIIKIYSLNNVFLRAYHLGEIIHYIDHINQIKINFLPFKELIYENPALSQENIFNLSEIDYSLLNINDNYEILYSSIIFERQEIDKDLKLANLIFGIEKFDNKRFIINDEGTFYHNITKDKFLLKYQNYNFITSDIERFNTDFVNNLYKKYGQNILFQSFLTENQKYQIEGENLILKSNNFRILTLKEIFDKKIDFIVFKVLSFEPIENMIISENPVDKSIEIDLPRYQTKFIYQDKTLYLNKLKIILDLENYPELNQWVIGTRNILLAEDNFSFKLVIFSQNYLKNKKISYSPSEEFLWTNKFDISNFVFDFTNDFYFKIIPISYNNLTLLQNDDLIIYSYLFTNKFYQAYSLIQLLNINSDLLQNFVTKLSNSPFKHFINFLFDKNATKTKILGIFEEIINFKLDTNENNLVQKPLTNYRNSLQNFTYDRIGKTSFTNMTFYFSSWFERHSNGFQYFKNGKQFVFNPKNPEDIEYKRITLKNKIKLHPINESIPLSKFTIEYFPKISLTSSMYDFSTLNDNKNTSISEFQRNFSTEEIYGINELVNFKDLINEFRNKLQKKTQELNNNLLLDKTIDLIEIVKTDYEFIYDYMVLKTLIDVNKLLIEFESLEDKTLIYQDIGRKIYNLNRDKSTLPLFQILFEFYFGYLVSKEQNELYNDIYQQTIDITKEKSFYQMVMGGGKTSVISPLLNLNILENHKLFTLNVLPDSLVNQSHLILKYYLYYLSGVKTHVLKIKNDKTFQVPEFKSKHCYLISDSSLKALFLNLYQNNLLKSKINILHSGIVIVDEVDMVNDTLKSETNFPLGEKIKMNVNIYNLIFDIIDLLFFKKSELIKLDINPYLIGKYNDLKLEFLEDFTNITNKYLSTESKENIQKLILNEPFEISPDKLEKYYLIKSFFNETLPLILNLKHRLNFGLVNDDDKDNVYHYIAIPYLAQDIPSYQRKDRTSSEFTNNLTKIVLTYLSFISNNSIKFRERDLKILISNLKTILEHNIEKLRGIYKTEEIREYILIENLKKIYHVNSSIKFQYLNVKDFDLTKFDSKYFDDYQELVRIYLRIMFNKYLVYNKESANISFLDILDRQISPKLTGFTGTPKFYIPFSKPDIKEYQIKLSKYDDGKIISGLTNKFTEPEYLKVRNSEEIFDKLNDFDVLIDVAALFLKYDSYQVSLEISKKLTSKKYFIYLDKNHQKMYLTKDDTTPKIFTEESVPLNGRFIYFDNGHITGQDFKLVPNAKGLITFDNKTIYRDISQGAFRLRRLNYGQTVSYISFDSSTLRSKDFINNLLTEENKDYLIKEKMGFLQNIRKNVKWDLIDERFKLWKIQTDNFIPDNYDKFNFKVYDFLLSNAIKDNDKELSKYLISKINELKTTDITLLTHQEIEQEMIVESLKSPKTEWLILKEKDTKNNSENIIKYYKNYDYLFLPIDYTELNNYFEFDYNIHNSIISLEGNIHFVNKYVPLIFSPEKIIYHFISKKIIKDFSVDLEWKFFKNNFISGDIFDLIIKKTINDEDYYFLELGGDYEMNVYEYQYSSKDYYDSIFKDKDINYPSVVNLLNKHFIEFYTFFKNWEDFSIAFNNFIDFVLLNIESDSETIDETKLDEKTKFIYDIFYTTENKNKKYLICSLESLFEIMRIFKKEIKTIKHCQIQTGGNEMTILNYKHYGFLIYLLLSDDVYFKEDIKEYFSNFENLLKNIDNKFVIYYLEHYYFNENEIDFSQFVRLILEIKEKHPKYLKKFLEKFQTSWNDKMKNLYQKLLEDDDLVLKLYKDFDFKGKIFKFNLSQYNKISEDFDVKTKSRLNKQSKIILLPEEIDIFINNLKYKDFFEIFNFNKLSDEEKLRILKEFSFKNGYLNGINLYGYLNYNFFNMENILNLFDFNPEFIDHVLMEEIHYEDFSEELKIIIIENLIKIKDNKLSKSFEKFIKPLNKIKNRELIKTILFSGNLLAINNLSIIWTNEDKDLIDIILSLEINLSIKIFNYFKYDDSILVYFVDKIIDSPQFEKLFLTMKDEFNSFYLLLNKVNSRDLLTEELQYKLLNQDQKIIKKIFDTYYNVFVPLTFNNLKYLFKISFVLTPEYNKNVSDIISNYDFDNFEELRFIVDYPFLLDSIIMFSGEIKKIEDLDFVLRNFNNLRNKFYQNIIKYSDIKDEGYWRVYFEYLSVKTEIDILPENYLPFLDMRKENLNYLKIHEIKLDLPTKEKFMKKILSRKEPWTDLFKEKIIFNKENLLKAINEKRNLELIEWEFNKSVFNKSVDLDKEILTTFLENEIDFKNFKGISTLEYVLDSDDIKKIPSEDYYLRNSTKLNIQPTLENLLLSYSLGKNEIFKKISINIKYDDKVREKFFEDFKSQSLPEKFIKLLTDLEIIVEPEPVPELWMDELPNPQTDSDFSDVIDPFKNPQTDLEPSVDVQDQFAQSYVKDPSLDPFKKYLKYKKKYLKLKKYLK